MEFKETNLLRRIGDTYKFNNTTKNIFLISCPEYGNIGDHAISIAMKKYAHLKFPDYNIYEITDSKFMKSIRWIIKYNKDSDYIFLIGGGNFGVLYIITEYWRRLVIRKCKRAKIILFPQSSVWGNDLYNKLQLNRSIKLYSKNSNLFLMAREKRTYDLMKKNFSNCVYLVPDVVLTQAYTKNIKNSTDVLMCIRTDVEKSISEITIKNIENYLIKKGVKISKFDTETYQKISNDQSEDIVNCTIEKFAGAKYVITDRLHGVIFSQITGTPCLAIDNTTKKISGVYDLWIDKNNTILYDENINLFDQIDKLLTLKKRKYEKNNNQLCLDESIDLII